MDGKNNRAGALRSLGEKILCNIFGGVNVDGRRVRKNNQELRELYGEHSITNRLRARKLEWLGHILRLPNERFLKKLTVSHIGGRKRRGRPRVRERERRQVQVEDDVK